MTTTRARLGIRITCPSCSTLLACKLPTGEYEIKRHGKTVAKIIEGILECGKCGERMEISKEERSKQSTFRVL